MKKEKFDVILKSLTHINNRIMSVVADYDLPKLFALSNSDVENYLKRVNKAKSEMDGVINDTYHIIGMCDLSGPQMSIFIKSVKSVLSYRNQLNIIAGNEPMIRGIISTRDLPKRGTYRLKSVTNQAFNL